MRLSDTIEQFIKTMLEEASHDIELKRNELAEYFRCAPSQINYVLATRFTPDHGYVIESRRGGGGGIRIIRIQSGDVQQLLLMLIRRVGEAISEGDAARLIAQLLDRDIISSTQATLISYALSSQSLSVPIPDSVKNTLRARIFRAMLTAIVRDCAVNPSASNAQEV